MVEYAVVLAAIFIGLISATLIPYFRKALKAAATGEPFKFDIVYIYNLGVSAVITFGGSIVVFLDYLPRTDIPDWIVLLLAFLFGYGGNELEKLGYKFYELYRIKTSPF